MDRFPAPLAPTGARGRRLGPVIGGTAYGGSAVKHYEVVIVGAGISGIGAAVRLSQQGIDDFVLLEKGDAVAGTWRDNTYPGCACDVPSALYSYSFAPNRDWSRLFAGQAEIRHYIERVAGEHRIFPRVRFGTEMRRAQWDEQTHRWIIETSAGVITAGALIAAAGPWNEPLVPDVPGLDTFPGEVFHSSRWNHRYDMTGKRVAVVGTGASAVQFIPEIQPKVEAVRKAFMPDGLHPNDRLILNSQFSIFNSPTALQMNLHRPLDKTRPPSRLNARAVEKLYHKWILNNYCNFKFDIYICKKKLLKH